MGLNRSEIPLQLSEKINKINDNKLFNGSSTVQEKRREREREREKINKSKIVQKKKKERKKPFSLTLPLIFYINTQLSQDSSFSARFRVTQMRRQT